MYRVIGEGLTIMEMSEDLSGRFSERKEVDYVDR